MQEFYDYSTSLETKAISDFDIVNIGYEQCRPGYAYGPILRPYYVIHFIESGEGELRINENIFELKSGDAFLIPMDKVTYYKASKEDPWKYYWVGFIGTRAGQYLKTFEKYTKERYVIRGIFDRKYADLIEKGAVLSHPGSSSAFAADSILYQIFSYLIADLGIENIRSKDKTLADDIKFYIDTSYAEPLQIRDLAVRFNIHPNYLTRLFRDKFQITPKQYLNQLKMQQAANLLITTNLSVGLIGQSLGMDDQLAFSKAFHKYFHASPREFRQSSEQREGIS